MAVTFLLQSPEILNSANAYKIAVTFLINLFSWNHWIEILDELCLKFHDETEKN